MICIHIAGLQMILELKMTIQMVGMPYAYGI